MGQTENQNHLPVDMRRSSGIGGGARENKVAASAHAAAVSARSGRPPDEVDEEEAAVEEETASTITECPRCEAKVDDESNFCGKCGRDLMKDAAKFLGIKFEPEDLDAYLFQGFLEKEVPLVGKGLVLRSSISGDHQKISDFLMKEWADKEVTQDFWENLKSTAAITLAIVSFDEKPIGDTVDERVKWMLSMGSALSDMVTQRVVLFNQAVTEWLSKKNTFLAS